MKAQVMMALVAATGFLPADHLQGLIGNEFYIACVVTALQIASSTFTILSIYQATIFIHAEDINHLAASSLSMIVSQPGFFGSFVCGAFCRGMKQSGTRSIFENHEVAVGGNLCLAGIFSAIWVCVQGLGTLAVFYSKADKRGLVYVICQSLACYNIVILLVVFIAKLCGDY